MSKIFFEDLEVGQKKTYGAYAVTTEEVVDFATKYDPQPFHIDEEAAKESVFGSLCASGWHTCSMMMRMMVDYIRQEGIQSMGSPGVDNIHWLKPVFPGNTLSVSSEVLELRESRTRPNIGLVKEETTVLNDKGETVMRLTSNYMIARRKD